MAKKPESPATVDITLSRMALDMLRAFINRSEDLTTRRLNNGAAELEEHIELVHEDPTFPPTADGRKQSEAFMRQEVTLKRLSLQACESTRVAVSGMLKKGVGFDRPGSRIALRSILSQFDIKEEGE